MPRLLKFLMMSCPLLMMAACSPPSGMEVDTDMLDLITFMDPDSDFATMDVRDIDGEIVRFDAALESLIWVTDDLAFEDWPVDGNLLGPTAFFQVRFGSEDGQQRAYFTETDAATICDLVVQNGGLSIFATTTPVPQE